jgi:hypothetical protein
MELKVINFISGVGIVLITVSGIAWRLTSQDAPSCRAMLGLASYTECGDARFLSRPPAAVYGPPRTAAGPHHHPYSGMLYSEFQYRPPPPSYQASMQEYRLRLLLMDRNAPPPPPAAAAAAPVLLSPPPAYRGPPRPGGFLAPIHGGDASRPPSYRSRASDRQHLAILHGRHPSQLSYLSQVLAEEEPGAEPKDPAQHASVVPVIPAAAPPLPPPLLHKASIRIGEEKKDHQAHYFTNLQDHFHTDEGLMATAEGKKKAAAALKPGGRSVSDRVTIVQNNPAGYQLPFSDGDTAGRSNVGGGGVVVTVSGGVCEVTTATSQRSSPEVDILAHL